VLSPSRDSLDVFAFKVLVQCVNRYKGKELFVKHSIFGANRPLPYQAEVRSFYLHPVVVWSVASVIIANFVVNILEKEYDPFVPPENPTVWENLDLTFNIIFLVELLVNMYGYGGPVKKFWQNGWNVFDFIIVAVGTTLMTGVELGSLSKLKLLRAFRVFRLFKRIESLNKIIVSLINAIPGVANAFIILFIFFCIYAILAVELFRDFDEDGTYDTKDGNLTHTVESITARGYTNGIEYYGTYSRAMFTLFQVMTGESWAEAIARPVIYGYSTVAGGFYFVSFVILTQMVLINVVVAVLLDKMVEEHPPDTTPMTEEEVEDFVSYLQSELQKEEGNRTALESGPAAAPPRAQSARRKTVDDRLDALEKKLDKILNKLIDKELKGGVDLSA